MYSLKVLRPVQKLLFSLVYPDWIRIGIRIQIWIQEGKNDSKNRRKLRNFMFRSAGCSLLRAEGFSFCLDILYGDLWISKLLFLIKKI